MTNALHSIVVDRLLADDKIEPAAVNLVDAAFAGDEALAAALAELDSAEAPVTKAERSAPHTAPPGVYLSRLKLAGFRGIGPEQTLPLTPGPGLTILVGRNGSGKSSFSEGLETLLTGDARRWAGRGPEWKECWRNLHSDNGSSFIEATFAVEGSEPVVVRRTWTKDAALEASELRVRRGREELTGLSELGWSEALATFRPFLSYAELGVLLNKPSELYDSLKGILGLEELATALQRISAARKARDDRKKRVKEQCKQLLVRLQQLPNEPRAQRCIEALKGRSWKLQAVEQLVLGGQGDDQNRELQYLRTLTQLSVPDIEAVSKATAELRRAVAAQAELAGSATEQNATLTHLLELALRHCGDHAEKCPVCDSPLTGDWASSTRARLNETQELGAKARDVQLERERCSRRLSAFFVQPPAALAQLEEHGLPTGLRATWQRWLEAPTDPLQLCEHAEAKVLDLHAELEPLRAAVHRKLEAMESAWLPVARDVAAWLANALAVETEAQALAALVSAEKWLKDQDEALRDARFEPIADSSQRFWEILRQQSSVQLAAPKLEGKANRRRVQLNVSVDGRQGVAVSVMSQGELNALALSLFLPRMMRTESPFRFLVIDDPVQAMDSHKVDGLAQVLAEVAQMRQVIVLTHDTRLLDATRRLGIDATIWEVERRAESVVGLQPVLDPVERHLKDALTIARNEQTIGAKMVTRTVPAFCRLAIESACIEVIRRQRLMRGVPHNDVEQAIEATRGVHPLVELAIEENTSRKTDVYAYLKNKLGPRGADAFRNIKEGSHGAFKGSAEDLIQDSRKIAHTLRGRA